MIRRLIAMVLVVVFVYLRIEQMAFAYLPDYVETMPGNVEEIKCSDSTYLTVYRYLQVPQVVPPCP